MLISKEESDRRLSTFRLEIGNPSVFPDSFPLPPKISPVENPEKGPISPSSEEKGPIKEEEKKTYQEKTIDQLLSDDPIKAENALARLLSDKAFSYAGSGTKALHRDTQAAIGVTASLLGTTKASRLGDVAITQAHSYERGFTGPADLADPTKTPKADLQNRIIEGHGIVVSKCFNRLLKTLDLLDDGKLEKVQKATDLSIIAKNLSSIVGHAASVTQDKVVDASEKSVHFHIMRPEQGSDADYPTINISPQNSPDYKDDSAGPPETS